MATSDEARRPLHVVTDDAVLAREGFTSTARGVIEAGGAEMVFHLRGHGTSGRVLYEQAALLVPAARAAGVCLVVNDRIDVALATGAAGVQLGARSLPVADARRLVGLGRLIGASVHDAGEAACAASAGADWLMVGTIFPSATHPGRPVAGTTLLRELAPLGAPLVGIGGVTLERVAEVLGAGAAAVAALRGIWDAADPAATVREYLDVARAARCATSPEPDGSA